MPAQGSRVDVQPVTWELPVGGAACWLVLLLIMLPAGQGAASWFFGGAFVWPHGTQALVHSIGGLLTGHPGAGLTAAQQTRVPPIRWVYLYIGAGELLLLAVTVWTAVLWWRYLGPGAHQGMADRAEVEKVLGVSNLRRRRSVIRPDLYHAPRGRQVAP